MAICGHLIARFDLYVRKKRFRAKAWILLKSFIIFPTISSYCMKELDLCCYNPFFISQIPGCPFIPIVGNMLEARKAEPMTNAIRHVHTVILQSCRTSDWIPFFVCSRDITVVIRQEKLIIGISKLCNCFFPWTHKESILLFIFTQTSLVLKKIILIISQCVALNRKSILSQRRSLF